jgi:hypothetical protein
MELACHVTLMGGKLTIICYNGRVMLFKCLICALIALGIVFAGVPVQAKSLPCPMAEMQMSSVQVVNTDLGMKDCDKCPKSAEKKQVEQTKQTKKRGCCDDAACNTKCAALSSVSSIFPAATMSFSPLMARSDVHPLPYLLPPSLALKTPEKPPKFLS